MKKGVLGRGLGALLTDSVQQEETDKPVVVQASINEIDVESIEVNPYQPRTDFDEEARIYRVSVDFTYYR